MRIFVLLLIPAALMAQTATRAKDSKAAPKAKPATAAAASGSISIPADAVEIAPQVYRYKDDKGKTWIYRRTPFGISKLEDRSAEMPAADAGPAPMPTENRIKVRAIDKGDTVRFEQQTPMGIRAWEKKKDDLTVAEKVLLDNSKPEAAKTAQPEK